MEAYDIGGSTEILRSFWDQRRPRVQTFFSSKDAHRDSWFLWYSLVHGNRGIICWPEGWFADGKVAPAIAANADAFKEVQGPVSELIVDGTFEHDPVALYYSHPSIQAGWALDASVHGRTWPRRSSSLENATSTSSLSRVAWLKTFEDLGIQAKVVHQEHLLAGLAAQGFKVLVLNRALCLSGAEAGAVRTFAAAGGTVIADHLCGILDGGGKAGAAGALDALFGVTRDLSKGVFDGETLTEVDAERGGRLEARSWRTGDRRLGLAVAERGFERTGTSRHAYLNLSPIGYLLERARGGGEAWREHVRGLLKAAGVRPRVRLSLDGRPAAATEALFWRNGDRITLCVVRNPDRRAVIDGFGETEGGGPGEAPMRLRLDFAAPVRGLVDERTGRELGDGASFEDAFTPWEANVYSFAR
jgi:hypothetical protein